MAKVCQSELVTLLSVKVCDYLACPNCGYHSPRRAGKCCDGACRTALYRWRKAQACTVQEQFNSRDVQAQQRADAKARRPIVRIGGRSLKALKSPNAPLGEVIDPSLMLEKGREVSR